MTVRRLAHGVAASLATVVLLGGCSDDPDPRFSEPTESPTPSGSATTPADPEQTAEEFIREWFELNTEMQTSGETEQFRAVSRACVPCRKLADQVEDFYAQGGYVRLDRQTVESVRRLSRGDFLVVVDAAPTKYRASESSPVKRLAGGPNEYRMQLRRTHGQWSVSNYLDTPS